MPDLAANLSDPLYLGDFRLNAMTSDLMLAVKDGIAAPPGAIKLRPNTAAAFEALLRAIKALDEVTERNLREQK